MTAVSHDRDRKPGWRARAAAGRVRDAEERCLRCMPARPADRSCSRACAVGLLP